MAIKTAKKTQVEQNDKDKVQLELVTMTPTQKRQEVTNLVGEIKLKKVERQKYLGHAKTIKNEIDELLDKAEKLAAEASTGQIKIELDALLADDDEDGEPVKSDFVQGLEDSLNEAGGESEDSDE